MMRDGERKTKKAKRKEGEVREGVNGTTGDGAWELTSEGA
jgi:hypothetical protein